VRLSPDTTRALARGRALYNSGHHWDAHEAWEEAWLEEEGDVKLFLQGLIQVAAAMHKALVQKQPASCVKLLGSALQKLDPLPADMGGVDLAAFRQAARLARSHAEAFESRFVPYLRLVGE
jgi:predicted metal-dependent hydrolase